MNPAQVFIASPVASHSSTVGIFLKKINNKNKQIAVRFFNYSLSGISVKEEVPALCRNY